MSSPPSVLPDHQADTSLADRDRTLSGLFPARTLVWIVEEQYEPHGPVWRVTLICPGERGSWARRRYRYDIPSGTLQFAGEMPVGDAELAAARKHGRRL